jgi:CheY-like chemotaxis protein
MAGKTPHNGPHEQHGVPAHGPAVLVVATSADRRRALVSAMRTGALACTTADSLDHALSALTGAAPSTSGHTGPADLPFEAVLIDLPKCSPPALRLIRALGERHIASVLICPEISFDDAVEAMRAGASDILPASLSTRELSRRVKSAVQQQRIARAKELRATPLRTPAAAAASKQPPTPAGHAPARTPAAVSTPIPDPFAGALNRFAALISGELDVEALLRSVLEFILAHAGATNAAVFLPGKSGDFSLGAYVNYTCPKDTAEVLLDHLANVAAPRLEHTIGVLHLTTKEQLADHIGDGCHWIDDSALLAFTCRADNEPLAVFTLFRERSTPFPAELAPLLARLGEVFAAQLARVIRIHHRHLPRDQWGALGDPTDRGENDGGLAA